MRTTRPADLRGAARLPVGRLARALLVSLLAMALTAAAFVSASTVYGVAAMPSIQGA